MTSQSRRYDSKDRVFELTEKLRRDRRKNKKMSRDKSMRRRCKKEEKRKRLEKRFWDFSIDVNHCNYQYYHYYH